MLWVMREVNRVLRGKLRLWQLSKQTDLGFFHVKIPWRYMGESNRNATFTFWVSSLLELKLSMLTQTRVFRIHQLWVWLKYKKAPDFATDCVAIITIFLLPKWLALDLLTSDTVLDTLFMTFTWPTKALFAFPRWSHPWIHFSLTVSPMFNFQPWEAKQTNKITYLMFAVNMLRFSLTTQSLKNTWLKT